MNMEKKLEAGQTVWLKYIGGIHNRYGEIKECKIAHVGRKWFTVSDEWRGRFNIETLLHDGGEYSPQYKVYTSIEQQEDELLFANNKKEIARLLPKVTLEQSIQILNILQS